MGRFAVTSLHADGLASRHELTLVQLAPNRCSRPVAGLKKVRSQVDDEAKVYDRVGWFCDGLLPVDYFKKQTMKIWFRPNFLC